uniref:Uncharacterized protein n=1 Tax=Alexandrium catenella TaxID=2925 RepID=A0A7S1L143_ALECA|mmetsp:Transcript_104138/g.277072  ORF Transcript_104138/g.277072 Transcript_104138/m.277072 type:complete len:370 (+) Transcript_104138:1-1110(+)
MVVHMEFEPLLSLHEPLGALLEEPAEIWANAKNTKKQSRVERAAVEDALAANRNKAKAVAQWMAEMGLEDAMLNEAADAVEEEPDELRYALNASKHFEVDDRDVVVRKTLLQSILDVMDSDIETVQEVIDKLVNHEADEEMIRKAVNDSGGELRLKVANGIELIEHVDIEAETKQRRLEDKEQRLKAKEEKRKSGRKRRKGSLASRFSRNSGDSAESEGDESSSESDEGTGNTQNREAEKKALAFRRLQVQRKIEDFLWLYRNGQNLQKINSKGRRYNRRVYIDTAKRALVIQGTSGPSFFPFINMKEIDIDTHTTKEGRVETHVICAMEKNGRIYKELVLAFPDQAKANNFVNCMTLFSLALRSAASK